MRILIVDDEPLIRVGVENIINNEFGNYNIEIVKAFDGIDALEKLKYFRPDFIITDICMPEMSGLELIDKVLKDKLCSRFIILTGYIDFEYTKKDMEYKSLDYISKPIDKLTLVSILSSFYTSVDK